MVLKKIKERQMAMKNLADKLRIINMQLENLKDTISLRMSTINNEHKSNSSLNSIFNSRFPYGCYDPNDRRQYTYKCAGCRTTITPDKKYKTTSESAGYIFICPNCKTPAFAYQCDLVHVNKTYL